MIDHNHITTTDHYKLFVALIGEYYDWDACERQNEGLEADDIIESALTDIQGELGKTPKQGMTLVRGLSCRA
ncbi:hypothetical protein LCGC14_1299640 [marine sediment metagenome]|uniref:Uncharacterized protein n=1 Tax=marine sediment metagenome TaxID=412755 RepID=A0A0F9KRM5_9ZZZZ